MELRRSMRNWVADCAFVGAAAALGGLLLLAEFSEEPHDSADLVLQLAIGMPTCALLLLFRRRWPIGLAITLIPLGVVSVLGLGASVLATLNLAMNRPLRVTIAVLAANASVMLVLTSLDADDIRQFIETVVVLLLLHVTMVAAGRSVRSRQLLIRSLTERAKQAEEGQRLRLEEARHLERERIAREMHDVLAHRISLLAMHAGALEVRQGASQAETTAAGVIRESAYEALEDLRDVIAMLRAGPDSAEAERPQPTMTDIPALIAESRRAGMRIDLEIRIDNLTAVSTKLGRHAYRVIQEGLTNSRKHAPGARVRVVVAATDQGIIVEITNPLPLADPSRESVATPGSGAGLIGLAERMDLIGGRLEYGFSEADGFRLHTLLPWQK